MTIFNEERGKAVAQHALKRFEDYKDNPMVQSLHTFITLNLERTLSQIASWGIEVSDKPSRTFYLRFSDGTYISGQIAEVWQVRTFVYEKKGDDSPDCDRRDG